MTKRQTTRSLSDKLRDPVRRRQLEQKLGRQVTASELEARVADARLKIGPGCTTTYMRSGESRRGKGKRR